MFRKVILFVRNIFILPKKIYKTRMFKKRAVFVGDNNKTIIHIGDYCQNCGKKENVRIGKNCDIDARIIANSSSAKISIGDYTTIRFNSVVGAYESIEIGSHCIISNNVTIYDNNNHPTEPSARIKMTESGFYTDLWNWKHSSHKPIIIKDNVWIGENL